MRNLINKLTLEKSISRDWSLINVELHQQSFVKIFQKQLGWSFTDVIYEGKEGTVTVYYPPKEYLEGMKEFTLLQLKKDVDWLNKQSSLLIGSYNKAINWINNIKNFDHYDNNELLKIMEQFKDLNFEIWPRFLLILMFPIQMEKDKRMIQLDKQIKLAIETRKKVELIGPTFEDFCVKIGNFIINECNLTKDFCRYISHIEVLNFLKEKIKPNIKELKKRKEYYIVANGGIFIDKISDFIKSKNYEIITNHVVSQFKLKGNCACGGKVIGQVKIILNKKSFYKLKDNDILVTGMTTPDFLPIMKKAAAFITNEGGITCHAAIVAREMNKPCVIGTKNATDLLKDGDLVEVDANKGFIKIIKKV